MRDVRTAIAGLGPHERDVLHLCVWSDLNYAQAAAALGVPVGTLRSRLARARSRLRADPAVRPDPLVPQEPRR